jgi:orotidine-5'-phosphate decarboxylase
MSFAEKLARASEENESLLCVGLDPDPSRMPGGDVAGFLRSIITATSDLVCAYKPNLAFYEQLGAPGFDILRATIEAIPAHIPVIADAKRGDIDNTAKAYARAVFEELGADAATVNPYLGRDAVEPFLEYADRGVIIVCRTSNPGARDLQDLAVTADGVTMPLYRAVAGLAKRWNTRGNVGLVTGATYPKEISELRELCPEMPFLLPGVGAQEGAVEEAVKAGLDDRGAGIIVNASRAVLYASSDDDFAEAARTRAMALREAIERCRTAQART